MKDDSARQSASYARRAASYWSVDGLPDILHGLVLVILGASACLWGIYAPNRWIKLDILIAYAGFALYFFLVERVVLNFLKSRLTYPRTGYVQPPEQLWVGSRTPPPLSLRLGPPPVLSPLAPSATENVSVFWPRTVRPLLVYSIFWVRADRPGHWLVPLAMPALAVALYVLNRSLEHPYPWQSALILALTGPVILWVGVPALLQPPVPVLLVGAWLAAQGVQTLVNYLRTNPYPHTPEGRA
jgi:hypothetical protein